ncbi:hypothetical protein [Paracoccus niistensis]|uniref:Uncharacterized protein n=1 Tax=Paracoccus niistensis TaxID=632935 RepID=A0ABV6I4K8_9RHOB
MVDGASAPERKKSRMRGWRDNFEQFENSRRGKVIIGTILMVIGALAGNAIDRGIDIVFPDQAEKIAEAQQALLIDRTDGISQGVQELRTRLENLGSNPDTAELMALQQDAARLVTELRTVAPEIVSAASRNANLVAQMRTLDLERTGATSRPALMMPIGGGAQICGGFTVGVQQGTTANNVRLVISRGGVTQAIFAGAGDGISLAQAGTVAGVSVAQFTSEDPERVGLNFTCDQES